MSELQTWRLNRTRRWSGVALMVLALVLFAVLAAHGGGVNGLFVVAAPLALGGLALALKGVEE